jgi:acetyltransferase-like isoleucine patch superfamily enzyme
MKLMKTDKIVKLFRYILALPKSLYVNIRLLPLSQAVKLPIIVSTNTKLLSLRGKVNLSKVKTGIVRIGFTGADMIDYNSNPTMLKIDGVLNIKGKTKIGKGSRFIIYGELNLGENFITTGDATVICVNKISIGNNSMLAWESIVMDTDQHRIFDKNNDQINKENEVKIGNDVWVGARSFILKNSTIEDGCVIGANTTLTKSFKDTNSIIAGTPPRVLKNDIVWEH